MLKTIAYQVYNPKYYSELSEQPLMQADKDDGWVELPLVSLDQAMKIINNLVCTLKEISCLHGEINPSNYDHDDVCELNRQFVYAITIADDALNSYWKENA